MVNRAKLIRKLFPRFRTNGTTYYVLGEGLTNVNVNVITNTIQRSYQDPPSRGSIILWRPGSLNHFLVSVCGYSEYSHLSGGLRSRNYWRFRS